MFRRRGPVRPIVRPIARRAIRPVMAPVVVPLGRPAPRTPQVPPALRRANELMAAGNYLEAAEIFDQFARGAEMRNGPRAPQFFIQAGRCRVQAGQVPAGMPALMHGLALFAQRGNYQQMENAGRRIAEELKQHGHAKEAGEVELLLKQNLPAGFTPSAVPSTAAASPVEAKPRLLPTRCPSCGGTLVSSEEAWLDESTAECPYCGSGVRAE